MRQRTLLNLGRHFDVDIGDWPALCQRIDNLLTGQVSLAPACAGRLEATAQNIDAQWLAKQRVGTTVLPVQKQQEQSEQQEPLEPDRQTLDIHSLRRVRPRSVGVEQVGLWAPADQSPACLSMTAVLITEHEPDPSGDPWHWLLLCSEGEATGDWAKRIQSWYEQRWVVEAYFRVLKTGTRIEDRRLDQADDLRQCLAFDVITAWRGCDLERAARDEPHRPADELMSAVEIKVLTAYLRAQGIVCTRAPPGWVPDRQTFAIDLARSVGFIPSRRQPLPGTQKLWQGMSRLMIGTACYLSTTVETAT